MLRTTSLGLLLLTLVGLATTAPGCGPATGIESGMPANTEPPPGFDPGGDAKPNMTGKAAKTPK